PSGVVSAQMPDPKQMSGMPLPVSDLPVGTVTVRLIRGQLTNPLPGQTVELASSGMTPKTAKSDESGRAQFTGLTPGTRVKASTTVDGETIESLVFELPADATGAGVLEGSAKNAVAEKGRITITGPFQPGDAVVQFAYTVPFGGDTITIRQKLPVQMTQFTILAQKVGNMQLSSP